ncbi:HD domain-containing protein [uncultured Dubosiella sp.]|uniref:HD domain-containing protein n=1 Tax=uncultured Dubosiella sp. TaxID=1937011 RepID=UPI002730D226|nr:HD domain-containing protein [uncultured Dubosiella sp.]
MTAAKSADRLQSQIAFAKEIDKEKTIERRTLLSDASRFENDAEHAWHAALMAIVLSEYANEDIDLLKTVTMLLIHDIVEIDAGDTYAYDEQGQASHFEREQKAANRLFGLLPADQKQFFLSLWQEFEERETPEAKFARCLDNFQPTMLNDATGGEMWKRNGIKLSQVLQRNEPSALGSKALWDYSLEHFIRPHVGKELKNE